LHNRTCFHALSIGGGLTSFEQSSTKVPETSTVISVSPEWFIPNE
jgi:hypothetical protein